MVERLVGKACVVTGVTGSLGGATAKALARRGATVALVARDRAKGEAPLPRPFGRWRMAAR